MVCENCISTRSIQTGKSYIKIEHNGKYAFMVTTSPIKYNNKTFILELLRHVKNEDVISTVNILDYKDITKTLKKRNIELVTDSLTGVYNRKFIDERIPYKLAFFQNFKEDFSLLLCDIDNFKYINDTYGHLAGDFVLQEFSKRLDKIIRKDIDWVARYGGDEFIILLDKINLKSTIIVANKLKESISDTPIILENTEIHITASFGFVKPNKEDTYGSILKRVDKHLYESKTTGKNKISY
ncbi:GGDEF domain-containing protein [Helicovermis profundi]|uniref:GGDEF domain-containing protein n=1 Tax=Helicovermis profundi TaxID=3065157 RepID=A0AAU9ETC7_9FIRM|nr:hypothetical protein HLPR_06410 [Clostridia bacterium S502]